MKSKLFSVILVCSVVCANIIAFSAVKKKPKVEKVREKEKVVEVKKYPQELKDGVKFIYEGKAKKVFVAGTFNNWNATQTPLKEEKSGVWSVILPLDPGRYEYKFIVDGNWMTDPANPNKVTDPQGIENSLLIVRGPANLSAPQITKDGVKFTYYAPKAKEVYLAGDFNNWADNQSGVVTNKEHLMQKGKDGVWFKTVQLLPGQYKYKFVVDGEWFADPFGEPAHDDYGNSLIKVMPPGVELGVKFVQGGVQFNFYAPDATKVALAGEFNNWSNDADLLEKDPKTGVWSIIKLLAPGTYKYKFVVDGTEWYADPFGKPANDEYGNSLLEVK